MKFRPAILSLLMRDVLSSGGFLWLWNVLLIFPLFAFVFMGISLGHPPEKLIVDFHSGTLRYLALLIATASFLPVQNVCRNDSVCAQMNSAGIPRWLAALLEPFSSSLITLVTLFGLIAYLSALNLITGIPTSYEAFSWNGWFTNGLLVCLGSITWILLYHALKNILKNDPLALTTAFVLFLGGISKPFWTTLLNNERAPDALGWLGKTTALITPSFHKFHFPPTNWESGSTGQVFLAGTYFATFTAILVAVIVFIEISASKKDS